MVLQAIQSCLHDIVYEIASTAEPIPFKGGVESLGDVATTIGDNSREVHMQLEQTALLHGVGNPGAGLGLPWALVWHRAALVSVS